MNTVTSIRMPKKAEIKQLIAVLISLLFIFLLSFFVNCNNQTKVSLLLLSTSSFVFLAFVKLMNSLLLPPSKASSLNLEHHLLGHLDFSFVSKSFAII